MKKIKQENSDEIAEKSLRNSVKEGSAHSIMAGIGESFVTPFAISIGATSFQIGLLKALPNLASSIFQPFSAELIDTLHKRKKILLAAVFLQAMIWIPMLINALFFRNTYFLLLLFSLYGVFEAFISPAFASWIGDLVPHDRRGRYFGMRNRITGIVSLLSSLLAGVILSYFEGVYAYSGFAILFFVAFAARMISFSYFAKMHEPEYFIRQESKFSFAEFLIRMPSTNYGRFVILLCLMSFAVNIAGPFFAVYMLRDLKFSYITFTLVTVTSTLVTFLVMSYWGKYSDIFGNKKIFTITGFLIPAVPLFWLFSHNIYYLIFAQVFSGFVWAGFNLATSNYVFDAVKPEKRARAVAFYNSLQGLAIFIGAAAGGILAPYLTGAQQRLYLLSELQVLFLISAILRFIFVLILLPMIKEVGITPRKENELQLFIRLVAVEPSRIITSTVAKGIKTTQNAVGKIGYKRADMKEIDVHDEFVPKKRK